jgi:peptide/nickel transport system substrate-binding protein
VEHSQTHSDRDRSTRSLKERTLAALTQLPFYARALFVFAFMILIGSSLALTVNWSKHYLTEVPRHGGTLVEGIIGRPRFINPVIAKSDADRDIATLIYSGLLRATPEGDLVPDLAATYNVSPDGLTYTFTLKNDLVWHDGEPITSADIAFTIDKVRDPGLAIKSPRRASWEGVTMETPDPMTIVFQIKQPYAPFLENATMGILPKHIWQNVPNDEFDVSYHNIEPIGSGPYRMGMIIRDNQKGLPSYYDLIAFKRYALGEPYITHLRIAFYGNNQELAQAYTDHTIDQMHALEPEQAEALEKKGARITHVPLPRIFAVYFNQNQQPIFADKSVRAALDIALDKDLIVHDVLNGYGKAIDSPLPLHDLSTSSTTATSTDLESKITEARAVLEKAGWVQNAANIYEKTDKKKKKVALLQFSIAMPDVPELRKAGELMKADWEKLGASVTLKVFEPSTFAAEVLSPRKFDALFYGQINGRVPDPFAYWHSSQRNAPGLNVALYANKNVDKFLEDARKESDPVDRTLLLTKFVTEITNDTPAVFVYSPDFLYATSEKVRGMHTGLITTESERFLDVMNWYIESEQVWKWFADKMTRA